LRDPYEPDDTSPSPIALGETQSHNFQPKGDIDQVAFLAKAGRWYRVATSDLALRVDTALEVSLGLGTTTYYTYTNDDRGPGDLSSEVVFRVPTVHDVSARVEITNRGQYGPDQVYDITVEEVYPDLMGIGETQERTFQLGIEDRVQFAPKVGRRYVITTSQLAVGVDTFVRVIMSGEVLAENDDYRSGSFASRVEFEAPSNDRAIVLITNLQEQYGPDKTYRITINEVPTASHPSRRGPGLTALVLRDTLARRSSLGSRGDQRRAVPPVGLEPVLKLQDGQAVEFVIVLELAR